MYKIPLETNFGEHRFQSLCDKHTVTLDGFNIWKVAIVSGNAENLLALINELYQDEELNVEIPLTMEQFLPLLEGREVKDN